MSTQAHALISTEKFRWPRAVLKEKGPVEFDLIRMGPVHRERKGIWCRPKKTKRRRRSFCIPLATVDAIEFDRAPNGTQ